MRKFTIINFLIGVTVAIVLSVLLVLGLRIFIPAPNYVYPHQPVRACLPNDDLCYKQQNAAYEAERQDYDTARAAYGGRIFVASNITGLAALILGLFVFAKKWGTNIAAGMIAAGAFGIVYGYALGWSGADDKIKFLVGLIVALIVITAGIQINRMKTREMNSPSH
jgi:hypothetical protein